MAVIKVRAAPDEEKNLRQPSYDIPERINRRRRN